MAELNGNQQQLIEFAVSKVLQKHGIEKSKVDLSSEEKQQMQEIVGNIKKEVEQFLENQNTTKTEKDFPNHQQVENRIASKPKQIFSGKNDINAAKMFLNKRRSK